MTWLVLRCSLAITVASVLIFVSGSNTASKAADGASGFYLLGSKGSLAGILAPPGTYLATDFYFYSGDASASIALPTVGGELALGMEANAFVSLATLLHVSRHEILGGRFALGAVVPIISKDVSARASLNLGGVPILNDSLSDETAAYGDPLVTAIIGWNRGNWHANFNALVNLPIGSYTHGALANAGFNRWGIDTTLALTYLNPQVGIEFTASPGLTFNGENLNTGYRTGTEFHVEFAAMQHFSPQFALGLNGYHYQQLSGDSGTAPGDFKGRVTALGPAINFNFQIGRQPVSGKAKFLYEFNTENRLEGNSGFLQFAVPLGVPSSEVTDK